MQQGQPDNGRIEDIDDSDHDDDVDDDDDNLDCVASSKGNMRMCGFDVDDVENLILLSPRIRSTVPHHLYPITSQPLPSLQVCPALMLDFYDFFAFFKCATVSFFEDLL